MRILKNNFLKGATLGQKSRFFKIQLRIDKYLTSQVSSKKTIRY